MKASLLALLAATGALIAASKDEIRDRCSEPTAAKFNAIHTDLNEAMKEGVSEDVAPVAVVAPQPWSAVDVEALGNLLGDRLALEVRAALDEAATPTA